MLFGLQKHFLSPQVILAVSKNRALPSTSNLKHKSLRVLQDLLCALLLFMHTNDFLEFFSLMVNRNLTPRASLLHLSYAGQTPGPTPGPAGILDPAGLSSLSWQSIVLTAPVMMPEGLQFHPSGFVTRQTTRGHEQKFITLQTLGLGC